jgi:hypothetical protein
MTTITVEQHNAIAEFLKDKHIPAGLGNKLEACSIAAINLAMTGELTDRVPACMSAMIGKWIIGVQDSMPDAMRNSQEWRELLPLAAGTGRKHEEKRGSILLDWMWDVVLPELQSIADDGGYGEEWKNMTTKKTAARAARAARAASAADAAYAASAASAASAADAAYAASAASAADAARAAYAASAAYWSRVDPVSLLARLIAVSYNPAEHKANG